MIPVMIRRGDHEEVRGRTGSGSVDAAAGVSRGLDRHGQRTIDRAAEKADVSKSY